jgi:hypothetical protein
MKTQLALIGDTKTLEAPKAIRGEDDVIYVEVGYGTEEATLLVGNRMAEVGADIIEDTGVLVALAPFVAETAKPA